MNKETSTFKSQKEESDIKDHNTGTVINSKNVVYNSTLNAQGDIHIGDKILQTSPSQEDIRIRDFLIEGNGYMEKGEFKKAIKAFEKILDIEKQHEIANFEMGVAFTNLSQFDKAIEQFTKLIEVDSNSEPNPDFKPNPRALVNRGNILYILNKHEEACKDWNLVKKLNHEYADEQLNEYCNKQLT